jgi:hypothetical protein
MQITKYGSYDATHTNNTLTLNGPNLGKTPTGPTEIWITGAGSKAETGIHGNTWVIRTPDGKWHIRTPGPSGQRGQHQKDDQGRVWFCAGVVGWVWVVHPRDSPNIGINDQHAPETRKGRRGRKRDGTTNEGYTANILSMVYIK